MDGLTTTSARAELRPAGHPAERLFHAARSAMGSPFEIYLHAADAARAAELVELAFEEVERVEAALSAYRSESELCRINAWAGRRAVTTDPETFELLARALAFSRRTDGAFDPTLGRLTRAWGFFRGEGSYPPEEELAWARGHSGWRGVELAPAERSVHFVVPGLLLDLGGVGKGYAVGQVAALLREHGVEAALVGSGTSTFQAVGAPPGRPGWMLRIPDPADRDRALSHVYLRDQALSTSGSYEKFFRLEGRSYCHIMDPRTGRPVEGMAQATAIAADATESELLSTAAFVLGPDRAHLCCAGRAEEALLLVRDGEGEGRVAALGWPGDVPRSHLPHGAA